MTSQFRNIIFLQIYIVNGSTVDTTFPTNTFKKKVTSFFSSDDYERYGWSSAVNAGYYWGYEKTKSVCFLKSGPTSFPIGADVILQIDKICCNQHRSWPVLWQRYRQGMDNYILRLYKLNFKRLVILCYIYIIFFQSHLYTLEKNHWRFATKLQARFAISWEKGVCINL